MACRLAKLVIPVTGPEARVQFPATALSKFPDRTRSLSVIDSLFKGGSGLALFSLGLVIQVSWASAKSGQGLQDDCGANRCHEDDGQGILAGEFREWGCC